MEAKVFGALVNGLIKRTFYAEADLDDATLKEQLAPELDDNSARHSLSVSTANL